MPHNIEPTLSSDASLDQTELFKKMVIDSAHRARSGTLIYPAVWMFIGLSTGWYQQQWLLFFSHFIGLTLFACLRMWILFRTPDWMQNNVKRGSQLYLVAVSVNALHWGVTTAISINNEAWQILTTPMLLAGCGVVAAGTAMLSINNRLRQIFPILILVPVIISLLWNINATNLLIAVLFMITIPYLTIASRFAHDDYWTAIKTTKLLEQAAKEFSRLSNTDPLTQLYNRLYFEEKFQQEWRRCSRSGHSISIVLIDLENFKEVNHIHGRLTGDHCLLKVADILRARVHRAGDVVARFDGEVFSILLPNTGAQNAEMIANRLRKAITARPIVIEQQTIKLMASAGVATTTPQHSEGGQQLIKNADRALYRAKEKDYNQVETISY